MSKKNQKADLSEADKYTKLNVCKRGLSVEHKFLNRAFAEFCRPRPYINPAHSSTPPVYLKPRPLCLSHAPSPLHQQRLQSVMRKFLQEEQLDKVAKLEVSGKRTTKRLKHHSRDHISTIYIPRYVPVYKRILWESLCGGFSPCAAV